MFNCLIGILDTTRNHKAKFPFKRLRAFNIKLPLLEKGIAMPKSEHKFSREFKKKAINKVATEKPLTQAARIDKAKIVKIVELERMASRLTVENYFLKKALSQLESN